MTGRDDGDPTLWLCRMWGDALTSPPSLLLFTPPEAEEGRIIVSRTSSDEDPGSVSSFKGIPNSTSKYREVKMR